MNKVLLIDGNNILHRAYHGLPLLKTEDGRYTNAVYGFLKMMEKILEQETPDYIGICFDKGKNTFRHREYPAYKAQRKPTDLELVEQFSLIREVLLLNGYLCLESDEFEADDIMGTLATKAAAEGKEAVIFSGDRDLLQVLGDHITVVSGKKKLTDLVKVTAADFKEKYGLEPIRLVDMKGLMGDSSDNIPGVKGVGEKTAVKLLTQYGSLENLYEHIDELPKNKTHEKLVNDKEMAFLSKHLAKIITDAPLEVTWEDLIPKDKDIDKLKKLYRDLEFRSLLENLEKEQFFALEEDNLFSMAAKERPFEITVISDAGELLQESKVALYSVGEYLYLAGRDYRCTRLSWETQKDDIIALLTDGKIQKHCANLKDIYHHCLRWSVAADGIADALEILAYLNNSDGTSYQPDSLCRDILNYDTFLFDNDRLYAETALIFDLCEELRASLTEKNGMELYLDVELPLVLVLASMENEGIRVDRDALAQMSKELGARLEEIVQRIYAAAGENFNLNSPRQMSVILFEKLQLPPGKKTKTGYSTNSEVLEGLREFHPIVNDILEYRTLSKLKSTYSDALGKLISTETGHIHTKFLQTVTTTGRLSSADPNLQNIPVRLEEGRKIRRAFVAADEDHVLLAADYSQIELRLLAHFSADPVLVQSFIDGEDIHARTAGEIFGIPTAMVTPDMRRIAKTVNFGIIYGMSSYSLGNDLGVPRNIAQAYINSYFGRYPNVKHYLDETIEIAREKGYSETLMGRRRNLPDLHHKNHNIRGFAERTAMNTPLQGSAADIIKLVMVKLYRALEENGFQSKIILQVHDELILDCVKEEQPEVQKLLKDIMEHTVDLRVPLTVDMKCGADWYHMNKI